MYKDFQAYLQNELNNIKEAGLYKEERVIVTPQGPEITLQDGTKALNFCANNYLGLADSKELVQGTGECSQGSPRHPRLRYGQRTFHLRYR